MDVREAVFVALVTPFSWSVPSAINQHVADLAVELRARGHRPVILTSSDASFDAERTRVLFHRARGQVVSLLENYRRGEEPDELLLPREDIGPLNPAPRIPVVSLGASLPVRLNGSVANLGLPMDVMSRLEKLLVGTGFDLLHVHEPLAPSLSFTALREARSPVVGTFHLTPVALAAYEIGQAVLDRFFLRLDARVVTFPQGREIMNELFPGRYEVISCGSRLVCSQVRREVPIGFTWPKAPLALYVYRGDGRRSFRALLRALATSFPASVRQVLVALHRPSVAKWVPRGVPRRLAPRVRFCEFDLPLELAPLYQEAAVAVLPYLGDEWLGVTAAEAAVCGCPVVGPDLEMVRDFLAGWQEEGVGVPPAVRGAVFDPSESVSLAVAVDRVVGSPAADRVPGGAAGRPRSGPNVHAMSQVAAQVEELYMKTIAVTRDCHGLQVATGPLVRHSLHVRGVGEPSVRHRLRGDARRVIPPEWINADLHVHTEFSKDCVTPVEAIVATAREIGLGALAIADHNEIAGAFLAEELAAGDPFIIVAEEIKTAQGEVIGLFLREAVPPLLSFDETVSLIKEQGGLVYVPHPFDALRTTPSYRTLVDNLHRIDVIEIYNAKVALSSFNLSAERFAAKYNLAAGAGSDAHVLQALGTAMLRMPRFHDPQSFMAALCEADIITRRKSLLYLQSLKLLRTTLDRVLAD